MAWRIARPNAVVVISAMYEQDQTLPLPFMYGKNLTFKTGGVDAYGLEEPMAPHRGRQARHKLPYLGALPPQPHSQGVPAPSNPARTVA